MSGEKSNPAFRLEQALRCWEDLCFRFWLLNQLFRRFGQRPPFPTLGPILNYSGFRKYLLENRDPMFAADRFADPSGTTHGFNNEAMVPLGIFSWNFDSRRIFHLTRDIQALLSATRLDLPALGDVHLPFDSFAITLEDPLIGHKGARFDCFLLSGLNGHMAGLKPGQFLFNFFSDDLDKLKPLGMIEKERLIKGVRNRDPKIARMLQSDMEMMRGAAGAITYAFRQLPVLKGSADFPAGNREITEVLPNSEDHVSGWSKFQEIHGELFPGSNPEKDQDEFLSSSIPEQAQHLAISLCLYLASLPPKEKSGLAWHSLKDEPGQIAKAITRAADVCTVSCSHTLTTADREVIDEIHLTRKAREMCVHWRRGHWRKAIGTGHDLEAPKTVWVRPTLVNRHRLPDRALPAGCEASLR